MVSERKLAANRANAKRSTGPKTAEGKRRSSRNAVKHGLSASAIPATDEIGQVSGLTTLDRGCHVLMETQLKVAQVRNIRAELVAAVLSDPSAKLIKRLVTLDRYELAALRQRKKAMKTA